MIFEKDLFYQDDKRINTFVCSAYPECELEVGGVKGLGVQIEEIGFPAYISEKIKEIIDSVSLLYDCGFTSQEEYFKQISKVLNYIFFNYTLMKEGKPFYWRDNRHPEKKPFPLDVKTGGDKKKRMRLYVSRDDRDGPEDRYNFSDSKMVSHVMIGKVYQPIPNAKFCYYLPYQDAVALGFPELKKGQLVKIHIMPEGINILEEIGDVKHD